MFSPANRFSYDSKRHPIECKAIAGGEKRETETLSVSGRLKERVATGSQNIARSQLSASLKGEIELQTH